ncbi:uncharacterized protein RBU57_002065 isoform 2-T2 [Macrochelys suwanniensis]
MAASCSKQSPAWSTAELFNLISVWEESELCTSRSNFDTYGQIACSLQEKGYDWDTLQCRAKVKELRKAYHKAREANCRSGAAPQTCRFYKELVGILGGDPTSTAKSTVDISVGLEPVESVPNPEEEVIDEEVEAEDGETRDASSQELFCTPEVSSQSLQSLSDFTSRNNPPTAAECLRKIRNWPRRTKEDMFQIMLQQSEAENTECKKWRESEKQEREEKNSYNRDATERMIKVMDCQTDMLQTLITLQLEQMRVHPPLHSIVNSFPCTSKLHLLIPFHLLALCAFLYTPPPQTAVPMKAGVDLYSTMKIIPFPFLLSPPPPRNCVNGCVSVFWCGLSIKAVFLLIHTLSLFSHRG